MSTSMTLQRYFLMLIDLRVFRCPDGCMGQYNPGETISQVSRKPSISFASWNSVTGSSIIFQKIVDSDVFS